MNKQQLINDFQFALSYVKRTHYEGVHYWKLGELNGNTYAIVLGWKEVYEDEDCDSFTHDGYRLAAKLAFQSNNSVMQCDYDIDWSMPYDENTNEVFDNEVLLYPSTDIKELISCFLETYRRVNYVCA